MPSDFNVTFADERRTIVLKADLEKGWRRLEKSFGFFRQAWIWYRNDLRARTMLTLFAQPATIDPNAAEFPNTELQGGDGLTNYRIERKILTLRIPLREEQPWRHLMGKRPGIFFQDLGLPLEQWWLPFHWIDLRAWLVFYPTDRKPIPDVRGWCQKLLVPGGQFESNRRRH